MPVAVLERKVNAPHAYCWDWLADFGALDKLHPPGNLTEFRCEGNTIGSRRFAVFKPELQIEGQVVERLDVACAPHVIVYSIVENYPLPMRDYVAVVNFSTIDATHTKLRWEGHYTEHSLPAAQMDGLLRDFYELFLGNIEKAYALGRKVGETPY